MFPSAPDLVRHVRLLTGAVSVTAVPPPAPPPLSVGDLATVVLAGPPTAGDTRVIAVDGPSGSGKSTFASRLAAALGAPVVAMDDLYPGWDGLEAGVARLRDEVLAPLARREPATWRRWDWAREEPGGWDCLAPGPAVVVDGVGSGARAVAGDIVLLVWVEAADDLRRRRALDRDGPAYGRHWDRWAGQERAHHDVERTRERADLTVSGGADGAWWWRAA